MIQLKRKISCCVILLFLVACSQLEVQAYIEGSTVGFHITVVNRESFEWVIQKYEIIEKPSPDNYTFFKTDDVIKIEVIGEPPTDIESWGFRPNANIADWLKFYKNDIYFNVSEIGYHPLILYYGFIYPVSVINDETINFFEYYKDITEATSDMSLMGGYSWKLGKDYFEVKLDQTSKKYVHDLIFIRKYNIHTGILSECVEEYTYGDTSFKVEIVNPNDVQASITIIIPIMTLLTIAIVYLRKRREH